MAQKPLKKVKVENKPTKYKKNSKKCNTEDSVLLKAIHKRTVKKFEDMYRNVEPSSK